MTIGIATTTATPEEIATVEKPAPTHIDIIRSLASGDKNVTNRQALEVIAVELLALKAGQQK